MIPLSKDEVERFTPPSLVNLPAPPAFLFRPATERDDRAFQRLVKIEGLSFYSDEQLQAEALRGLRELWSPEAYASDSLRLMATWESLKQGVEIPDDELKHLQDLDKRLVEAWRPLREMQVANLQFLDDAPKLALALFVIGWQGIDVSFQREAGSVPLHVIDQVEKVLARIEADAEKDKIAGIQKGMAFVELCNRAFASLNLTKDEEKNSPSPSQSEQTPAASITDSPSITNGSSPGKPMTETPEGEAAPATAA